MPTGGEVLSVNRIDSGKGPGEEGIYAKGKLIYGKRSGANGDYYSVGKAEERDGGFFIRESEPKVVWVMNEKGMKIYRGNVNDQVQYNGHGYEVKEGCENVKVFEGEYVNGKRHGNGKLYLENGEIEKGTWRDGVQVMGSDNEEERKMRAQFPEATGRFVQLYKESVVSSKEICVFIGFVDSYERKEAGRVYSDDMFNELVYEGWFKDDKYVRGTLYMDPRYTFTGEFENGEMKRGKLELDKHVLYEGEVNANGEMHGRGVLYTVDKNPVKLIDGCFWNNKTHGPAKVYYADGSLKYCGYFKEGLMDGKGVLLGENHAWMIGYRSLRYDIERVAETLESATVEDIMRSENYILMWIDGNFWNEPITIATKRGTYSVVFDNNLPVKLNGGSYGAEWKIQGEAGCSIDEETSPFSIDIGMMHVVLNGEVVLKCAQYAASCRFENGELKHCKLFMDGKPLLDSDCYQDREKEVTKTDWIVPHGKGIRCFQDGHSVEVVFEKGKIKAVKDMYFLIGSGWLLYSGTLADDIDWSVHGIPAINGRGSLTDTNHTLIYEGDIKNNAYQGEGKAITYRRESTGQYVKDKVYEGSFENGKFMGGRVTDYSNHQNGWDCVVTQNLMIDRIPYRLVYGMIGEQRCYDRLVSGTDIESGLFVMGDRLCWGTKRTSALNGSSHWYAYSPRDLDSIFTVEGIPIEKRIAGLKLMKSFKHENGKLIYVFVVDRMGVETRFYPDEHKGKVIKDQKVLYEGGMKQQVDATGKPIESFVAEGQGKSWDDDGAYEGQWKDGMKNGEGKSWDVDGTYEGQWKDGMKNGKGKLIRSDKSVILGFWVNDKLDGEATVKNAKGQYIKKKYRNGEDLGYYEFEYGGEVYMLDKTMELEVKRGNKTLYKGKVISMDEACETVKAHSGRAYWRSSEEKRYYSILEWLQSDARSDNASGFCLPYHYYQYFPHGNGVATYQQSKYKGEFFCGVRYGTGKEWSGDVLLYDGSWAFDRRHGEGFETLEHDGPSYSCIYNDGVLKEINGYYLGNDLIFAGSVDQNYIPYSGTFYVIVCDYTLSGYMKKGFTPGKYSLKGDGVVYDGVVKMNGFRFVLDIGTLTIGKRSFTGLFNEHGDCDDCIVKYKRTTVFEGSIRGLKYYVGTRYCNGKKGYLSEGDEEGFFKDDVLVDGYRMENNVRRKVKGAVEYDKYLESKRSHVSAGDNSLKTGGANSTPSSQNTNLNGAGGSGNVPVQLPFSDNKTNQQDGHDKLHINDGKKEKAISQQMMSPTGNGVGKKDERTGYSQGIGNTQGIGNSQGTGNSQGIGYQGTGNTQGYGNTQGSVNATTHSRNQHGSNESNRPDNPSATAGMNDRDNLSSSVYPAESQSNITS